MLGMPKWAPDTAFTIEPDPCATMCRIAWVPQAATPTTFTDRICSSWANSSSPGSDISNSPALLTSPSMRPVADTHRSTRPWAWSQSDTSATCTNASASDSAISAATAEAASSSTPFTTTDLPPSASIPTLLSRSTDTPWTRRTRPRQYPYRAPSFTRLGAARSRLSSRSQKVLQAVAHDAALLGLGERRQLRVDVLRRVGEALAVGEVRAEDDGVDADLVDHPADVLLGVGGDHEVLAEDLRGPSVEAAVLRPLRLAPHEEGVVHLAQGVRQPHRAHLGQADLDVGEAPEEVVQDEPRGELHGRPVAPVHHPLEGVEVAEGEVGVLRPVGPVLLVVGTAQVDAEPDPRLVHPGPHRVEDRVGHRPAPEGVGAAAVGVARFGLDDGGTLAQDDLELLDGELRVGKRDIGRQPHAVLDDETDLFVHPAVERPA